MIYDRSELSNLLSKYMRAIISDDVANGIEAKISDEFSRHGSICNGLVVAMIEDELKSIATSLMRDDLASGLLKSHGVAICIATAKFGKGVEEIYVDKTLRAGAAEQLVQMTKSLL